MPEEQRLLPLRLYDLKWSDLQDGLAFSALGHFLVVEIAHSWKIYLESVKDFSEVRRELVTQWEAGRQNHAVSKQLTAKGSLYPIPASNRDGPGFLLQVQH